MKKGKNSRVWMGLGIFLALMLGCTLISRGIYAAKLPQVTVITPKRMAIDHRVEAAGSIKPARKLAKNVMSGLLVKEVFVTAGDSVEEGQALFLLDTDHIREQISKKELEEKKLELQIATMQSNLELAGEEKTKRMQRALEDGAIALTEADKRIERAKEDLEYAKRELALYAEDTPETDDEEEWKLWEEGRKALALKVQDAERGLEDAEDAKGAAVLEAGRKLQDDFTLESADASLGVAWMEFQDLKEEIAKLKGLLAADGEILSECAAVITEVNVSAGEMTAASAAVSFADAAVPLQFEAVLNQEQKKYVEPGAAGELTLGSFLSAGAKTTAVTVDYLTELPSMPGSFYARMLLPEGVGTIGQNGIFTLNVQSESFSCCIPADALYKDGNQRSFVYVLEETNTILGTELAARKRVVNVLDSNERYAAVEPGAIGETDRIIETATEKFEDGDVVRMKE